VDLQVSTPAELLFSFFFSSWARIGSVFVWDVNSGIPTRHEDHLCGVGGRLRNGWRVTISPPLNGEDLLGDLRPLFVWRLNFPFFSLSPCSLSSRRAFLMIVFVCCMAPAWFFGLRYYLGSTSVIRNLRYGKNPRNYLDICLPQHCQLSAAPSETKRPVVSSFPPLIVAPPTSPPCLSNSTSLPFRRSGDLCDRGNVSGMMSIFPFCNLPC